VRLLAFLPAALPIGHSVEGRTIRPETRFAVSHIRRVRPDVTVWLRQPQALVRAWYRSLAWPRGSAANSESHAFPAAAAFVGLPPTPLSPGRVARWVRALRTLAGKGVRR